jgi:hypothetical protein
MRRLFVALGIAGVLVAGMVQPANAQVTASQEVASAKRLCTPPALEWLHINNSFGCLGDFYAFSDPEPWDGNLGCIQMSNLQSAGYPAPNGWSNQMSSGINTSDYAIGFFDAFSCAGPVLFAMNANTWRNELNSIANNKASSFKIVNRPNW